MKKINLIIEIVLAVAIAVLFVLHFLGNKAGKDSSSANSSSTKNSSLGNIAYVHIDTVYKNYEMYTELRDELTTKQKQLENDMENKTKNYQSSVLDYQNKIQKGLVTRANAAEIEQQLTIEQQKLVQLRDQYQMQLAEEEQVMNRQILNNIMEYLKIYNKDKKFQYILGNTFGSNILYAENGLDITEDVIKGLNAKYKADNPQKSKKK